MKTSKKLSTGVSIGTVYVVNVVNVVVVVNVVNVVVDIAEVDEFTFHKKSSELFFCCNSQVDLFKKQVSGIFLS